VNLSLEVRGAPVDLHSGHFGGAAPQAAVALVELITSCYGHQGGLAVSGLESTKDAELGGTTQPTDAMIRRAGSLTALWGDRGSSATARTTVLPALVVTSLTAGHQGDGPKSIVPSWARAKLNLRIPPRSDPTQAERILTRHLGRQAARIPGVRLRVTTQGASRGIDLDVHHWATLAAARAYEAGFGRRPDLVRSGGTIPPAAMLQKLTGAPVILAGFGLPDDRVHGPDERLHLPTFHQAVVTSARLFAELGATSRSSPPIPQPHRGRIVERTRR
jgi:acetylornithine deacetylase/succinyl-diaminopimelate desuccinylase-like protein